MQAYNFAPDLEDETRYKKFKEEQLSRVKITAHIRKTPRLDGLPLNFLILSYVAGFAVLKK